MHSGHDEIVHRYKMKWLSTLNPTDTNHQFIHSCQLIMRCKPHLYANSAIQVTGVINLTHGSRKLCQLMVFSSLSVKGGSVQGDIVSRSYTLMFCMTTN